jgi:hypothetical protein
LKKLLSRKVLVSAFGVVMVAAVATSALFLHTGSIHAAPASPAAGSGGISAQQVIKSAHSHHLGGVIVAGASTTRGGHRNPPPPEPAFDGTPPLLFNGSQGAASCVYPLNEAPCDNGNVMMTQRTGPLTIVPIYWSPTAYPMSASYKSIITSYLNDVAKASGSSTNVFSVANEYYGLNGQIRYNVRLGPVITDTNPITSGCTVDPTDMTGIYADNTGYSACVDDAQLTAEVDAITAANHLRHDLSHIYVVYLPKGVETCFLPGTTTDASGGQACTINHQVTAAYCAYHSTDLSNAVYANLSYPIYESPVGYTCGSDARYPDIEAPNGNPDADTEVSPTSHEINEALTDPDVETGWYDSNGFENGDECAYIYGASRGPAGAYYNQTIAGGHFLTQEEFSNNTYIFSGGTAGCLQGSRSDH